MLAEVGPEVSVGYFGRAGTAQGLAQDGEVLAQESIPALASALQSPGYTTYELSLHELAITPWRSAARLADIDVLYGNGGPLTTLAYLVREKCGLSFSIVREIHTTAWIGCHFQEAVASVLGRAGDRVVYPSLESARTWEALRPTTAPMVYQAVLPLDWNGRRRAHQRPRPWTLGFFSRFTIDKGATQLASIVRVLRQGGIPVRRVLVAGAIKDPALMRSVGSEVENAGAAFEYVGPQPHCVAVELMGTVDAVAFPSTSSFESAGRVVIEALGQGVPVIAGSTWAAFDLLPSSALVAVRSKGPLKVDGTDPRELGMLDLTTYNPATLLDQVRPDQSVLSRYMATPAAFGQLASGASTWEVQPSGLGPPRVNLAASWTEDDPAAIYDAATLYAGLVRSTAPTSAALRDLGGVPKQAIRDAGFGAELLVELVVP